MRASTIVASLVFGLSTPAMAGGVGLLGTAGVHSDRAYYYRDDGEQGIDFQSRPNLGGGLEVVLGDRDDRVLGVIRLHSITDWPVKEPDLSKEDTANYEFTYPAAHLEPKHTAGALTVGVQWGLWGDPAGFQVIAHTMFGAGFATKDNLEFVIAEPGAGAAWTLKENLQLYGIGAYTVRYRKAFAMGANAYVGVRYLFD